MTPSSLEVLSIDLEFRFWIYKKFSLNTYVLQKSNSKNYKYFHGKGRKITTFLFWVKGNPPSPPPPTSRQDILLVPPPFATLKKIKLQIRKKKSKSYVSLSNIKLKIIKWYCCFRIYSKIPNTFSNTYQFQKDSHYSFFDLTTITTSCGRSFIYDIYTCISLLIISNFTPKSMFENYFS